MPMTPSPHSAPPHDGVAPPYGWRTHRTRKQRYYTPTEVARHCDRKDCWISLHGAVLDVTQLIQKHQGNNADRINPILAAAGTDVSHWFTSNTLELKGIEANDGKDNATSPPQLALLDAEKKPTDTEAPWWKRDEFRIGSLTHSARRITVVNTLTDQSHLLEVCEEETLAEICDRMFELNTHAASYTWKRLGVTLDMDKTLTENGVLDERDELGKLGIPDDDYIPALHLYFNDDLTEA